MAKFAGKIGFVKQKETAPDVWEDVAVEREYYGDILTDYAKLNSRDRINTDFDLGSRFSIVSDAFANENLGYLRYVTWMGTRWNVSSVETAYPRLNMTVGGVYNGPIPE